MIGRTVREDFARRFEVLPTTSLYGKGKREKKREEQLKTGRARQLRVCAVRVGIVCLLCISCLYCVLFSHVGALKDSLVYSPLLLLLVAPMPVRT